MRITLYLRPDDTVTGVSRIPADPIHDDPMCLAESESHFVCTAPEGHTGPHRASGTEDMAEIWEDR